MRLATWPVRPARRSRAEPEAALLEAALEVGAMESLPRRLRELAVVAGEVARALQTDRLTEAERLRIGRRAVTLARRHRTERLLGIRLVRRRPVVAASIGGGAAALGITVAGIALLRRSHPMGPMGHSL